MAGFIWNAIVMLTRFINTKYLVVFGLSLFALSTIYASFSLHKQRAEDKVAKKIAQNNELLNDIIKDKDKMVEINYQRILELQKSKDKVEHIIIKEKKEKQDYKQIEKTINDSIDYNNKKGLKQNEN